MSAPRKVTLKGCTAVASASTETFDLDVDDAEAIQLHFKSTTASGYSFTPSIQAIDPVTGLAMLPVLLTGVPMTAACEQILEVGKGLAVIANVSTARVLPRKIRVSVTHTDATSVTYSITGTVRPRT